MMEIDDYTSPGDHSSPENDALAKLQREADEEGEYDDLQPLAASHPSFSKAGQQLSAWRTYTRRLTDANVDDAFPDLGVNLTPSKPRLNRWTAHQLRQTKEKRKPEKGTGGHAVSDMGLFSRLPGELRNYIYRLAFVAAPEDQPVLIEGSDLVCGTGACVHKRAPVAAPGIASTCQQIRNELMPIFCAENTFKFNAAMVRNRCVGNWVRSMNTYARMIRRITLEILVLDRNGAGGGTDSQTCDIVLGCPVANEDWRFELSFDKGLPKEKVDASGLKPLVEKLNDGQKRGQASKLVTILQSEPLAELVYRCRK